MARSKWANVTKVISGSEIMMQMIAKYNERPSRLEQKAPMSTLKSEVLAGSSASASLKPSPSTRVDSDDANGLVKSILTVPNIQSRDTVLQNDADSERILSDVRKSVQSLDATAMLPKDSDGALEVISADSCASEMQPSNSKRLPLASGIPVRQTTKDTFAAAVDAFDAESGDEDVVVSMEEYMVRALALLIL